jgi:hypothetical protein
MSDEILYIMSLIMFWGVFIPLMILLWVGLIGVIHSIYKHFWGQSAINIESKLKEKNHAD